MKFDKGKTRDYYLLTTDVENVYINEYMTDAPGDYVKAYIYGLFCAEHDVELKPALMADVLRMDEDHLREAWEYWQRMGVVEIHDTEEGQILEFISLRERIFSGDKPREGIKEETSETAEEGGLKEIISMAETSLGRPLNGRELQEIRSWTEELEASPELIREAFEYCLSTGKNSINYIAKVVLGWTKEGLKTKEDIREHLEMNSERHGIYRRILNSIGLRRNITEAEKKMVDAWLDEMKFSMERILEACEKASFTQNPNLRYVNKVLENWKQEADSLGRDVNQRVSVTQNTLNKYFEYLRNKAEKNAEDRKQEVYNKLPEIRQIDINLQSLSSKISRGLLGGSSVQEMNDIRQNIRNLEKERAILLTENNFALDYTDIKYLCAKCGDTGVDENGQRCSCVKDRMGEAELWQNGKL